MIFSSSRIRSGIQKSKPFRMRYMVILIATLCYSCKKFVTVPTASNLILQDAVFTNDQTANSAIAGLYSKMVSLNLSFSNGGLSLYAGISSDELYNVSTSSVYDPFSTNTLLSDNSVVNSNFWTAAYRNIYQANAIIEGLEQSTGVTLSTRNQLLGEAKFVRAFNFFYLVNLFGDVPLTLSTDYTINAVMPRTDKILVYAQMVTDLTEAEGLLGTAYSSNFRVRPNKWTAAALLARIYLYTGDWASAEAQSTLVINSGIYNLESNLANVFLTGSKEAIWQLMRETANTVEGTSFIPASATVKPTFALTTTQLNTFEPGDLRKTSWTGSNTVSAQVYYYPYKYKIRSSTTVTEYQVLFRLAEQYLIRAEARAKQDHPDDAIADLNILRARSRAAATIAIPNPLPNLTTTLGKSDVLTAIAKERQTELFAECGHRWFDLKRTGAIDNVLITSKPGWRSTAALFPIPYTETQTNIYLTQNPGYVK